MANPLDVANFILTISEREEGELISNLKIQKLVYYCQGFHLAITGKALFEEEIEAWLHGPVVPSLYQEYKQYGADAIPIPKNFNSSVLTAIEKETIIDVYEVYGQYSALKLRNLTHNETPWKTTEINHVIPKPKLRKFFDNLLTDE